MQIKYKNIILRDFRESDIEDEVRWNTVETQWALWDGPWEMEKKLAEYNEEENRRELREYLEKLKEGHRWSFEIDTVEGVHIGSVNAYRIDEDCNWRSRGPLGSGDRHQREQLLVRRIWYAGVDCLYPVLSGRGLYRPLYADVVGQLPYDRTCRQAGVP